MAEPFNPYAPPQAELDAPRPADAAWRDGKLVRMDRDGSLPGRCVTCNAPALAKRVERTLYWTPWQWRAVVWATPLVLLGLMSAGLWMAGALIMPALLVLAIANAIIRKRVDLELGVCARHARLRQALGWTGIACMVAVIGLPFASPEIGVDRISIAIGAALLALTGVGLAYGYATAQRVALKRLTAQHLWLKGTGAAFRNALPEAPRD